MDDERARELQRKYFPHLFAEGAVESASAKVSLSVSPLRTYAHTHTGADTDTQAHTHVEVFSPSSHTPHIPHTPTHTLSHSPTATLTPTHAHTHAQAMEARRSLTLSQEKRATHAHTLSHAHTHARTQSQGNNEHAPLPQSLERISSEADASVQRHCFTQAQTHTQSPTHSPPQLQQPKEPPHKDMFDVAQWNRANYNNNNYNLNNNSGSNSVHSNPNVSKSVRFLMTENNNNNTDNNNDAFYTANPASDVLSSISHSSDNNNINNNNSASARNAQSLYLALSPSLSARLPRPASPISEDTLTLALALSADEEARRRAQSSIDAFLQQRETGTVGESTAHSESYAESKCDDDAVSEHTQAAEEAQTEDTHTVPSDNKWSGAERTLALLFTLSLLVFHSAFSLEELLAIDYAALALSLTRSLLTTLAHMLSLALTHSEKALRERLANIDPAYALYVTASVIALTAIFDRDTDKTDRTVRDGVSFVQEKSAKVRSQLWDVSEKVRAFFGRIFAQWQRIPRILRFCLVSLSLSFAAKYVTVQAVSAVRPYVVKAMALALSCLPYALMVLALALLTQLVLYYRAASTRQERMLCALTERAISRLRGESEFIADVRLCEEMEREIESERERVSDSEWQTVNVRALWPTVCARLKKDRDVQANELYAERALFWGYKPNKPTLPKL